jgi:hypothetical protein
MPVVIAMLVVIVVMRIAGWAVISLIHIAIIVVLLRIPVIGVPAAVIIIATVAIIVPATVIIITSLAIMTVLRLIVTISPIRTIGRRGRLADGYRGDQ